MSSSQSKLRQTRKAKTSINFEVKQYTEQNIQVGQSMNIISLINPLKNRTYIDNIGRNQHSFTKTNNRRPYQTAKLTLKHQGSSNNLSHEDQNSSKTLSLYTVANNKKCALLLDKYQKRNLVVMDRNRVVCDVASFSTICFEFLEKIDNLSFENGELSSRVKRFQTYFKQLKAKQPQIQSITPVSESPPQKPDRTSQLKILNLQRKVQTLSYIIKNYRANNKEEIKEFEKKIYEYKPSLENQLKDMLMETNKKYEEMAKLVQYFQSKLGQNIQQGLTWAQVVDSLRRKDQEIDGFNLVVGRLQGENKELKQQIQTSKGLQTQLTELNREIMEANYEKSELNKLLQAANKDKESIEESYYDVIKQKQNLTYKYEALLPLESKIREKQQLIRKSSVAYTRLQSQNTTLRNKIGTLTKNYQAQFFNKETGSIETIEKCSTTIQELASRFLEEIDRIPEVSMQVTSFITHLFEKTKTSFQKMVEEYRVQLQAVSIENKQLKNRLNSMIKLNQRKFESSNQILKDIQGINAKRKRCEESQAKIDVKDSCQSCLNWVSHWGQLNSLYGQIEGLVHRFREIQ